MAPRRALAAALLVATLAGSAEGARWQPGPRIDVADYHEILAPFGDWLVVEPWGWVWTPDDVEPGWRPYTHGRWAFTHAGWTWVSYWEWGWAPFHYGRWTYHRRHGWIWIPGRVWAPAWVAWRSGDDWVGWAPLPPQARWRVGHGLELGDTDLDATIPVHAWTFAGERDFVSARLEEYLAPLPSNDRLVRQTENVTRYAEEGREVAVYGPERRKVEKSAGTIEVSRVRDVSRPPTWSQLTEPRSVHVYRPEVADAKPRPKPGDVAPKKLSAEDLERRRAREIRRIDDWAEKQQRELDRLQKQEAGKVDDTRRQQEREALAREVAREKELLEGRLERLRAPARP